MTDAVSTKFTCLAPRPTVLFCLAVCAMHAGCSEVNPLGRRVGLANPLVTAAEGTWTPLLRGDEAGVTALGDSFS